ncbi:MAG: chromate transporter [Candidatus Gracilibacteria bacterium]
MTYVNIFFAFFKISFISFGGAFGALPELQRIVVDVHHWMSAKNFIDAYVIGQFVPGPNMAMSGVIGYMVAGILGWFVALAGIYSGSLITMRIGSFYFEKHREVQILKRVELALRPLVLGLITASAIKFFVMQSQGAFFGAIVMSGLLVALYVSKKISAISVIFLGGPLWWVISYLSLHL